MAYQAPSPGTVAVLLGPILVAPAYGGEPAPSEPPPAIRVRLIRPDLQLEQVLALFQGTRASSPARALAAWKRGAGPGAALAKSWEAAIAAFNPEMVPELRGFDQAELAVSFSPGDGATHWFANVPRDDGALASLATALVLTDGKKEPPLEGIGGTVDRLGPSPWPLAARAADRFALADTREGLRQALGPRLGWDPDPRADLPAFESGWLIQVDPQGLGQQGPLARRRVAEALRALDCTRVSACAGLAGEALALDMALVLGTPLPAAGAVDPAWLDGLPEERLLAVFATAIDPSPAAWQRRFALADRIERADPAHAGVAPLRTRINLLAAGVKVRPEVDLWPHLRGLTAALLVDQSGTVDGAIVTLHTDTPESAARIGGTVLPALAPLLGLRPPPAAAPPGPGEIRLLGQVDHRPVGLTQRGTTVRVGWGEPGLESIRAEPAGASLRTLLPRDEPPPERLGALWPGRLAAVKRLGAPLAATLSQAPPVQWSGRNEPAGTREAVRWPGLHDLVRRFLDCLPLDPPPQD
jgi:hypothetical protein